MIPLNDDALDQTLARLASVDIPDGLEQRILTALASHAATSIATESNTPSHQPSSSARRWPIAWPHRPTATTPFALTGLAAALALTVVGLRHISITPTAHQPQPTRAAKPFPASSPSTTPQGIPAATETRLASASLPATPSQPHPTAASIPSTRTNPIGPEARTNPVGPETDAALALAETNAPSQLAPSLPLTDDERALQHLAQQSTPSTLLALDPSRRAAEQAAEEAAFVSFFTPPTVPTDQHHGESE